MSECDARDNMRELMGGLFALNCAHFFQIESDGKCYSKECMMNSDPILAAKIQLYGCKCFENPEVKRVNEED